MIPIFTVFGCLLVFFALVGSLRGAAKELIVTFSVILALFVEHVLRTYVPFVREALNSMPETSLFYTRAILFLVITVFGYASTPLATKLGAKLVGEHFRDRLLGFFLGAINGFLVVGTVLSFLDAAHYGVQAGAWREQQKVDAANNPVLGRDGRPVMEVVYTPGVKGIGGIEPPPPDSPTRSLIPYLPPNVVARSNAVLYIGVAVAFVFVIVVFI